MSSDERAAAKDSPEEIDDIFGDASDEEPTEVASKTQAGDEGDLDDDDEGIYGASDGDNGDDERSRRDRPVTIQQTTIPRYPPSHRPSKDTYFCRVPAYMTLDPKPFDADAFLQEAAEVKAAASSSADGALAKLRNENTIRWKYARDADGNVTRQSNARYIRWSDGSLSLQMGADLFDVVVQDPYETNFLTLSHPANELLQTSALLSKNMALVPTSTSSATHKRLAEELSKRQVATTSSVGSVVTTDDPERRQREAEKAASLTLKARRKLEQKQRLMQDQIMGYGGVSRSRSPYPSEPTAPREREPYRNDEYEEDDFVVEDEDEEEEGAANEDDDDLEIAGGDDDDEEEEEEDEEVDRQRAQRLAEVKKKGAEVYAQRTIEDDEDADSQSQNRKKRRIIGDDDDDE